MVVLCSNHRAVLPTAWIKKPVILALAKKMALKIRKAIALTSSKKGIVSIPKRNRMINHPKKIKPLSRMVLLKFRNQIQK